MTGDVETRCQAWVSVGDRSYVCDLGPHGFLAEHANREAGIRWFAPRKPNGAKTHGLRCTYMAGCRCEECTEAARPGRRRHFHARQRDTSVAPSRCKQWTGPELEVAARDDLTTLEVAKLLGRTYSGVKGMRAKLLRDPRKQALAGLSRSVAGSDSEGGSS